MIWLWDKLKVIIINRTFKNIVISRYMLFKGLFNTINYNTPNTSHVNLGIQTFTLIGVIALALILYGSLAWSCCISIMISSVACSANSIHFLLLLPCFFYDHPLSLSHTPTTCVWPNLTDFYLVHTFANCAPNSERSYVWSV